MLITYVEFCELDLINRVVIMEKQELTAAFKFDRSLESLSRIFSFRFKIDLCPKGIAPVALIYVLKVQNVLFYPYVDLHQQIAKPVFHRPPNRPKYGLFIVF